MREGDYKDTCNVAYQGRMDGSLKGGSRAAGVTVQGRWPANICHDGSAEVVDAFPDAKGQQGALTGAEPSAPLGVHCYGRMDRRHAAMPRGDTGSAARFFYSSKASRRDRNEGLDSSDTPVAPHGSSLRTIEDAHWRGRNGNPHPTVKPTNLMRHLCRLITPPGGDVLDPWGGSMSTGKAAVLEGFSFTGVDDDREWCDIGRARLNHALTVLRPREENDRHRGGA